MTYPLLNIIFFYFQLEVQLEHYYDPYTGKLMEAHDKAYFKKHRMNVLVGLIVLFLGHSYYIQKDLITYAIKNHMIARQQTQLKKFFGDQEDPTFVCNELGTVSFCNPAALKLF